MSALALLVSGYTDTSCCRCGLQFCLTTAFFQERRKDGKTFYCPNGHSLHYGESEAAQLKKQLEAERQRADRAEQGRKWAESDAKGARISAGRANAARRRLEHRVNCGVCPHCRRSFKQLAAHIKSKHPAVAGRRTKG